MLQFKNYLIFLLIFLMSCLNSRNPEKETQAQSIKYLALGDSYTIGESVLEQDRWPNQLAASLNSIRFNIDTPQIIAKTGWTSDELLTAINDSVLAKSYDLVSLLIGVNNQYRGYSVEIFRNEFAVLLDKAIEFARNDPAKVFVVSIPDWGVTPFAQHRDANLIASEIDLFNQIKKEECVKKNILFIDITDISRNVKNDSELVAADGLHPSAKMYQQWVDRIHPKVARMIQN